MASPFLTEYKVQMERVRMSGELNGITIPDRVQGSNGKS
jgi:hypothetical protein